MAGCFGGSQEDKWKENISLSGEYELEDEEEEKSCEYCNIMYLVSEANNREPELYCSHSCRALHYLWSDEPMDKQGENK